MVLEWIVVNGSSEKSCNSPEMYQKGFIGRFPSFCKLLRVGCCLKNYPGDIFLHVLAAGLVMMV